MAEIQIDSQVVAQIWQDRHIAALDHSVRLEAALHQVQMRNDALTAELEATKAELSSMRTTPREIDL